MPRSGIWFISVLVLLGLFFLGPRARLDPYSPRAISLPSDLDSWLSESEARVPNLRPGTEKKILWTSESKAPTPISLVFLHGFSASRGELSPLVENVAKNLGANTFFTRFSGHGADGSSLGQVTDARIWLDEGREALAIGKRLGQKTVLVGMSTGGTIATWLAANQSDVSALVLVSPNYGLQDTRSEVFFYPWGIYVAKLLAGSTRDWVPENPLQERIWTNHYPLESLSPMLALTRSIRDEDFRRITAPTLLIYSPQDDRVDLDRMLDNFEKLGTAKKSLFPVKEAAKHVLAGDASSPSTTPIVEDVIESFLKEDEALSSGAFRNQRRGLGGARSLSIVK